MVIPGTAPPLGGPEAATPYPSTIAVSGLRRGGIRQVAVTLTGLTHTWPSDLEVLLVGPNGQPILLMHNVGGSEDVIGIFLTFSATARNLESEPLVSGTYQPPSFTGPIPDSFLPPAPAGTTGSILAGLKNSNPNGIWRLYIVDEGANDTGTLDGWLITITARIWVRVKPRPRRRTRRAL